MPHLCCSLTPTFLAKSVQSNLEAVFRPLSYSKKLINTQMGFELLCLKMRSLFLNGYLIETLVMIHSVKVSHRDVRGAYEEPRARLLTLFMPKKLATAGMKLGYYG